MNGLLALTFRACIGILDISMENHNIIETTLQQIQLEILSIEDNQRDEVKYILVRFEKYSMLELHMKFIRLKNSG